MKAFFDEKLLVRVLGLLLGLFFRLNIVLADQAEQVNQIDAVIDSVVVIQEKSACSPEDTIRFRKAYEEWSDVFVRAQEDKDRLSGSHNYSDADKEEIKKNLQLKQVYALAQLNDLRQQGYVPENPKSFMWLAVGLFGAGVLSVVVIIAYILLKTPTTQARV